MPRSEPGWLLDKMLALTGQMPASVQIANIVLPTPEERARTDAAHRTLDEISKLLRKEEPLDSKGEAYLVKAEKSLTGLHNGRYRNAARGTIDFGLTFIESKRFDFT